MYIGHNTLPRQVNQVNMILKHLVRYARYSNFCCYIYYFMLYFSHTHHYYKFDEKPTYRTEVSYDCGREVKYRGHTFVRVWCRGHCTYVCNFESSVAASSAKIVCKDQYVDQLFKNINNPTVYFKDSDFNFLVVREEQLRQLFAENHASVAKVKELSMSFSTEVAKNEMFIKVIEEKLGDSFIVTQRPVTERQGYRFSPYS